MVKHYGFNHPVYRGKTVIDDEWIYGYYDDENAVQAFAPMIIPFREWGGEKWTKRVGLWKVVPKTVSRSVYLFDVNGKELFTADIVEVYYEGETITCQVCLNTLYGCIEFRHGNGSILFPDFALYREEVGPQRAWFRIIGNIYDDPELMPDEQEDEDE